MYKSYAGKVAYIIQRCEKEMTTDKARRREQFFMAIRLIFATVASIITHGRWMINPESLMPTIALVRIEDIRFSRTGHLLEICSNCDMPTIDGVFIRSHHMLSMRPICSACYPMIRAWSFLLLHALTAMSVVYLNANDKKTTANYFHNRVVKALATLGDSQPTEKTDSEKHERPPDAAERRSKRRRV